MNRAGPLPQDHDRDPPASFPGRRLRATLYILISYIVILLFET
jgi:hypothetical protein